MRAIPATPRAGLAQGRFVLSPGPFGRPARRSQGNTGASMALWVPCQTDRDLASYSRSRRRVQFLCQFNMNAAISPAWRAPGPRAAEPGRRESCRGPLARPGTARSATFKPNTGTLSLCRWRLLPQRSSPTAGQTEPNHCARARGGPHWHSTASLLLHDARLPRSGTTDGGPWEARPTLALVACN